VRLLAMGKARHQSRFSITSPLSAEMRSQLSPDEIVKGLEFHTTADGRAFLAMLRPYSGIDSRIVADLASLFQTALPLLASASIRRDLVASLWSLSAHGRTWAIAPAGMLQRNRLTTDEEFEWLSEFFELFDYLIVSALEGSIEEEVVEQFRELVLRCPARPRLPPL
jgi:hypothetical protein